MGTFGVKVRELREARGLSRQYVASRIGVAHSTLRDIECKPDIDAKLSTIRGLRQLFCVTYDELINDLDVELVSTEAIAEAIKQAGEAAARGNRAAAQELTRLVESLNAKHGRGVVPAADARKRKPSAVVKVRKR